MRYYFFSQDGTNDYSFLQNLFLRDKVRLLWHLIQKQQEAISFLLLFDTNGQEDG